MRICSSQHYIELVQRRHRSKPLMPMLKTYHVPIIHFDTIVGMLVLCTIPDPARAIDELHRVCGINGRLLLIEHVRLRQPALDRLQDWLTSAWKRMCAGCHLNRNTVELVERNGFHITKLTAYHGGLFVVIEARSQKQRTCTP
ncbi:methyltransferase domain-containing protein [Paenibacillus xerothermodurans]|uniref:Methyltransferase domain-containing protein n=1 Tax=Paenibacillus xerothermodurans TaxID=1977292 RepID=A0A2W1NW21_PAEXE|nr:methyltransferase domain-containing protein [Paenibacillus xerothermodurans]